MSISMSSSSMDLVLKPVCERCGSTSELYGSECKHMTLCRTCGEAAARARAACVICKTTLRKLIREYNVRANTNTDKSFYIGRFVTGLPPFSKKKSAENKWTLHKEGLQGRQLADGLRDKYKNKPWILEDETGQHQYQGQLEGAQSASYYLLVMHGKEFVASPAGSWYNFNKIAQYKQLTLEEAEEKMSKRKNNATGYERWMMKAATNGPAAFGEKKSEEGAGGGSEVARPRKAKNDDGDNSDKGDEDEEEEAARKSRLGLNKKGDDDDDEGGKGGDLDLDDDDVEKGDDWEHEEIFTDDDEAVGNDPEEREDLAPEIPAPPEIKQDDGEEGEEEEGGLSKSGKELKKLLGKAAGLDESDGEDADDDDDEDDMDDEVGGSPVLAPKHRDAPKDEPTDISPLKSAQTSGSNKGTQATKSSKAKRKPGSDDAKAVDGSQSKKIKVENDVKPLPIKEESSSSKATVSSKNTASESSATLSPISEDEIRNVLLKKSPLTTQELVNHFKSTSRLNSKEERSAFASILQRISKVSKKNGRSIVLLRET